MQFSEEFEITKIVLDKGLLAIVVAVFSWVLARSIERLKASLSWNGELLKQRMDAAKRSINKIQELKRVDLQMLGGFVIAGTGGEPQALFSVMESVGELKIELSILQVDKDVLGAIDNILKLASGLIGAEPPGMPGIQVNGKDGSFSIKQASAERAEWARQRMEKMNTAIKSFEKTLAEGFPSL